MNETIYEGSQLIQGGDFRRLDPPARLSVSANPWPTEISGFRTLRCSSAASLPNT
jgi:hypothetical protein